MAKVDFGGSWLEELEQIAFEKGWVKNAGFKGRLAGEIQKLLNSLVDSFSGFAQLDKVEVDNDFGPKSAAALDKLRKAVMDPKFEKLYATGETEKDYHDARSKLHAPEGSASLWAEGLRRLEAMFMVSGEPNKKYLENYPKGVSELDPSRHLEEAKAWYASLSKENQNKVRSHVASLMQMKNMSQQDAFKKAHKDLLSTLSPGVKKTPTMQAPGEEESYLRSGVADETPLGYADDISSHWQSEVPDVTPLENKPQTPIDWYNDLTFPQQSQVRNHVSMLMQKGTDKNTALQKAMVLFSNQFKQKKPEPEFPTSKPIMEGIEEKMREKGYPFKWPQAQEMINRLVKLANDLEKSGSIEAAEKIDQQIALYKMALDKLYDISGETGEDLVNSAHKGGGVVIAPSKEEGGKVETLVETQEKMLKSVNTKPTGKYASLKTAAGYDKRQVARVQQLLNVMADGLKALGLSMLKVPTDGVLGPKTDAAINSITDILVAFKSSGKHLGESVPDDIADDGKYASLIKKLVVKAQELDDLGDYKSAKLIDDTIEKIAKVAFPFVKRSLDNKATNSDDLKAYAADVPGGIPVSIKEPGVVKRMISKSPSVVKNIGRGAATAAKAVAVRVAPALIALGPPGWVALGAGAAAIGLSTFGSGLFSKSESIPEDIKDLLEYAKKLSGENYKGVPEAYAKLVSLLGPYISSFSDSNLKFGSKEEIQKVVTLFDSLTKAVNESVGIVNFIGERSEDEGMHFFNVHKRILSKLNSLTDSIRKLDNQLKIVYKTGIETKKNPGAAEKFKQSFYNNYIGTINKTINLINSNPRNIMRLFKNNANKVQNLLTALENEKEKAKEYDVNTLNQSNDLLWNRLYKRLSKRASIHNDLIKSADVSKSELAEALKDLQDAPKDKKKKVKGRRLVKDQVVEELQNALKEVGIDTGKVDGFWGPLTAKAYNELINKTMNLGSYKQLKPIPYPDTQKHKNRPSQDVLKKAIQIAKYSLTVKDKESLQITLESGMTFTMVDLTDLHTFSEALRAKQGSADVSLEAVRQHLNELSQHITDNQLEIETNAPGSATKWNMLVSRLIGYASKVTPEQWESYRQQAMRQQGQMQNQPQRGQYGQQGPGQMQNQQQGYGQQTGQYGQEFTGPRGFAKRLDNIEDMFRRIPPINVIGNDAYFKTYMRTDDVKGAADKVANIVGANWRNTHEMISDLNAILRKVPENDPSRKEWMAMFTRAKDLAAKIQDYTQSLESMRTYL